MSPKPFAELCHRRALSPPRLSNATGHVAPGTPATLRPARSPSSRSTTCSELGRHLVSTSAPRPPWPGELTRCSSFQRDEESASFHGLTLHHHQGMSLGHFAGSSKSMLAVT